MTPYIALVSDQEAFDPVTHARQDLVALAMERSGADNELTMLRLRIKNPRVPLSSLPGRRVLMSESGNLLFDGRLSYVPRGSVGATVDIEAVARPDDLEQQLAAIAESLKVAPFWDPLFVPQGSEGDLEELLAGYSLTLAYSPTGQVSAVDALGGASSLSLMPLSESLRYDREAVAPGFGVELSARWKQAALQRFFLGGTGAFSNFSTMTPDAVIQSFPKPGASIGDGFTVSAASAAVDTDAFGDPRVEVLEQARPVSPDELDPAFIEEGQFLARVELADMEFDLTIEHSYEVNRTETCAFTVPVALQDGATEGDAEIERIELRDIAERSSASPWQPETEYAEGDEAIDGTQVFRARTDHVSGRERDPALWVLVGEASYVASRRVSSFFRSERGQAALAHAMERVRARARIASRAARVDFEAAMPSPWLVNEDCEVTIAHDRIPGGSITGRLIAHTLRWEAGRRSMTGTIAACVGADGADTAALVIEEGSPVSVGGRVRVEVTGAGDEQRAAFEAMEEIPATEIRFITTPAPAGDFEHAVSVSISGAVMAPKGVEI